MTLISRHSSFFFLLFLLVSCANYKSTNPDRIITTVTSSNLDANSPLPTPDKISQISTSAEVTFLLRNRSQPLLKLAAFRQECLTGEISCQHPRMSSTLPPHLYQVLKLFWTPNGKYAFFWDSNTGDIYSVDGNSGEITRVRSQVWKVRSDFFISPDGEKMIFEIDTGVFETDIVSMNIYTGEMTTLDISIPCMKFVSGWLTNNEFLFWCEIYTGSKGYLENINVYTFNLETRVAQPFEPNRDWMQTSVPKPAPNGQRIVFTNDKKIIIRDLGIAQEYFFDLNPENYIWSLDSDFLAVYTQEREIFIVNLDSKSTTKLFSLSENVLLEDWLWLPDNKGLLLVMADKDTDNKTTAFLSMTNHNLLSLDLSLFAEYRVISISYRPMLNR